MIGGASRIDDIPNVVRHEDFRDIALIDHSYGAAG